MNNVFDSLSFIDSELSTDKNLQEWLESRNKANEFIVDIINIDKINKWHFNEITGNLQHESGKFFSIIGLHVKTDFGNVNEWQQVIINQPEIGILGIITKVIKGTRYFLMQAKMEPGNINILQLSPTLQATRSNYKLAHKGKAPLYLEYFLDKENVKIIVDQLQSEQGGRFLRKRNRNMIIEVFDEIEVHDDFKWMTLGQIKKMMHFDNLVNMDARSVISCIPIHSATDISFAKTKDFQDVFDQNMVASLVKSEDDLYTFEEQLSWINEQKTTYELDVQIISLKNVKDWQKTQQSIKHKNKPFFEVIGVNVKAGNREVTTWSQPLIADKNLGLIAFIIKLIKGKYYFLVQAKVEPGNIDVIDLAPSISVSNYESYLQSSYKPHFYELVINTEQGNILYDQIHSEEGGRFYHLQNRYMIVINNDINEKELLSNFRFMTLEQIMKLSQFGFFNIESRGLISCLDFINRSGL